MLTLVTSNPSKYKPFLRDLERLRIGLERPPRALPELQSLGFADALSAKAEAMAAMFGRPVLVDDSGIVLEAYRPFPGPLTSVVLRSLGRDGLTRLLRGVSDRATMECHLGCWVNGGLRSWTGAVRGRIDTSRPVRDERMMLTDLFRPQDADSNALLEHRTQALAALEADAFALHLDLAPAEPATAPALPGCVPECPFCAEFDGDGPSIFSEMLGGRLASRVVYEDEDFVIMPPLGEFIPGGLLLLTRQHIPSFSFLSPALWGKLQNLLNAVGHALNSRWGVAPLVFEHGPASERSKGHCCVDHAHFNIFPASVHLHPHLSTRMNLPISSLDELSRFQSAEFGYLFVQENDGTRRAYDGQHAPTQLVRRIITSHLGMPERWHWRDFPGRDELIETYLALKGQILL